jgi:Glycosyl hydrolase family 57
MPVLHVFAFFHLNLTFSSIEENQRPEVIRSCYWPLLRLVSRHSFPAGIEAPALTLQMIAQIDPAWLAELRRLVRDGACEFIGSGYTQLIGPLVPVEVNEANLALGNKVYGQLLGLQPTVALINEQTYSAGLVPLYLRAGYKAIVMEWDNAYKQHPEWGHDWRYFPQYALGSGGKSIPLIWNKSVPFQKFQRYAHDEMELENYLEYLREHASSSPRAFPLYGNDAEIFDFRPGRFETEAPLHGGEWERIDRLIACLQDDPRFTFVKPSEVLELLQEPGAGSKLVLENASQPVPVKKQEKYNLTRWAVTGRDNLEINTACWRIYETLKSKRPATDDEWRELCYLWSSDFRTHITSQRWEGFRKRLEEFSQRTVGAENPVPCDGRHGESRAIRHSVDGPHVIIENDFVHARLNCRKGMALDSLTLKSSGLLPLCGMLPHGYFDDISWAADYYTGHLVFEGPGMRKVTDLNPCRPEVSWMDDQLKVTAEIPTKLGRVRKVWSFREDSPAIGLRYELSWPTPILGSLRLGHVTLMPEAFERKSLFYATHNGGHDIEKFFLNGQRVDHGRNVSFLVSAAHAVGITKGLVEFGDRRHMLRVQIDKKVAALIGLVTYQPVKDKLFCRLSFSARELDDTSKPSILRNFAATLTISPSAL